MDWLDLFAVQGTLKNLLQHHISKASILRCSAFFVVQLSHLYMSCAHFFVTLLTVACQAPLSIGFSRQEYCRGLPILPPGYLLQPGIKSSSLHLLYWKADSLPLALAGKPQFPYILPNIPKWYIYKLVLSCLLCWQAGSLPLAPPEEYVTSTNFLPSSHFTAWFSCFCQFNITLSFTHAQKCRIAIYFIFPQFSSVQFNCLSCLTLCDPMDCSTPGLPVHNQLPEITQTHVH